MVLFHFKNKSVISLDLKVGALVILLFVCGFIANETLAKLGLNRALFNRASLV